MEKLMNSWFKNRLTELNRDQLEQVASAAIFGLAEARNDSHKRDIRDYCIMAFASGLFLATSACFIGFSLH
jgi:hypothetical protein